MTAGTVVVLGEVGLNLGAGMTGGEAYVHDPEGTLARGLNDEFVLAQPPDQQQLAEVRALLERHVRYTGSERAGALLTRWEERSRELVRIAPKLEEAVLVAVQDDAASEGAGK